MYVLADEHWFKRFLGFGLPSQTVVHAERIDSKAFIKLVCM